MNNTVSSLGGVLRLMLRAGWPFALSAACLALIWPQLQTISPSAVLLSLGEVTVLQWALAPCFVALSFLAVSQYDVLAHRQLRTGLARGPARLSGLSAIAISQTTGFGVVVAGLVRWRALPQLGPATAAQVTVFVSLLFMAALAGWCALTVLILPFPPGYTVPAALVLAVLTALAAAVFWHPRLTWRGETVELPSLHTIAQASLWAGADIMAACMVFYLLLPPDIAPPLLALLPVFCAAVAAGLFSGTPGGVGPFEMVVLTLTAPGMPAALPPDVALTAVIGSRAIYYALPALLGAAVLMTPHRACSTEAEQGPTRIESFPRAESAVLAQNPGAVVRVSGAQIAAWRTGQADVCLFDPATPSGVATGFFNEFEAHAKSENRLACVYKSSARTAIHARRSGWRVLRIAQDAVVHLPNYGTTGTRRSNLRRKLRRAEQAGVTVRPAHRSDLTALILIDTQWQAEHGRARGGTMGRLGPDTLARQAAFVAERDGQMIGFVSFHMGKAEWALDVMRHLTGIPDGTMYALLHYGIVAARAAGAERVSLSAVPDWQGVARRVLDRVGALPNKSGLRQFKASFDPHWMPLYVAAPSWGAMLLCLLDIAREVHRPAPLDPRGVGPFDEDMSLGHKELEDYEVASIGAA